MKMKIEKIPLPTIGGCRIYVVISKNLKEAAKHVFKDDDYKDVLYERAEAVTCHREEHSYVFFQPNADAGTVAHEVWHALRRQFKRIGAKLENELFAYHLEYVVNEVVDILKKWGKKIS